MTTSLKPLRRQVIVITGASSGIGLATAYAAAKAGAKVVLSARNEAALAAAVETIKKRGGKAVHVRADVADRKQVDAIVATALRTYGRIDTWVNNAGVDIWGTLEQVSDEDHRRLFETNFWGLVNGSLAALPQLKKNHGALINLGSLASDRAFPLQGMYSASKHAIKGFTDALRMELEHENAGVSVTLIKPAAIGTPLQAQAKSYLAREPRLPSPLYAPEDVADAILHAARTPRRDLYIGSVSAGLSVTGMNFPRITDLISEGSLFDVQMRDVPAQPRQDNLYEAGPKGGMVRGDPENRPQRRSTYTRASLHPRASGAIAVLTGAAAILLGRSLRGAGK